MLDKTVYCYGARTFTLEEIAEKGRRHREDGIQYHPPSEWGGARIQAAEDAYNTAFDAARYLGHGLRRTDPELP